jgi:enterobactin synthetase component D
LVHAPSLGLKVTLLFSAKESLYKALFPIVGALFDFTDFEVVRGNEEYVILKAVRSLNRKFLGATHEFCVFYSVLGEELFSWCFVMISPSDGIAAHHLHS